MSLQVFFWSDFSHQDHERQRIYYNGFTLQETKYQVGDSVYLFPESDGLPLYLGRIQSAFADCSPGASDAHCVEVRWFEKLANLEPNSKCVHHERELVELEDADVNPIGCLAGKAPVFRVKCQEEAEMLVKSNGVAGDWFFIRGMLKQSSNEFVLYSDAVDLPGDAVPKRVSSQASGPEDMADSDDICAVPSGRGMPKRQKRPMLTAAAAAVLEGDLGQEDQRMQQGPSANKRFCKGPGKQCVECGATQTPQWREGPAGPKTLCNACGVRYNRLRSSKRNGNFGPRQSNGRSKPFKHAVPKEAAPAATMVPAATYMQSLDQLYPQQQQQQLGPGGRPLRQAAVLAANRTAAFARTGAFPLDEDDALLCAGPAGTAGNITLSSGSGNGDCSHNSSESAEEMFLQSNPQAALMSAGSSLELQVLADNFSSPEHHHHHNCAQGSAVPAMRTAQKGLGINMVDVAAAGAAVPSAPTARTMDAAASLVVMASDLDHTQCISQGIHAVAPAPLAAGVDTLAEARNALRSVALRAVNYSSDMAEFGEVFASFERVRSRLPDDLVSQLLSVTEQLDAATNEAAAADAALQAVMQVMASRQKAADTARERASNAVDKLKGWMCELSKQYGSTPLEPVQLYGSSLNEPDCCEQYQYSSEQYVGQYAEAMGMDLALDGVGSAGTKDEMAWSQLDQEAGCCLLAGVSLLEDDPLGGAADCDAALLGLDCSFDGPLIKVQD